MAKNFVMNRRTLFLGSAAVGGLGLLTACGGGDGGSSSAESASALGVGEDIAKLVSINPKERDELQDGGELRLAVGTLGPDFSPSNQNGNTSDNISVMSTIASIYTGGLWQWNFDGEASPNPAYCESFESKLDGDVQTHTIKLNPDAKYNDGTPIDIEALRTTWEVLKDAEAGYNIVDPGGYPYIESIEEDGDAIKVTMSKPYYPVDNLFAVVLHPKLKDKEEYNNGFNDDPRPELLAGPFKLEKWNSSEKVITMVPNDKWWGEKPKLERITFRQMEAAATRAAFKNGEVDAAGASTLTAYKDVEGTEGSEMRRGQRLFAGGMDMASGRIPLEVRKAIFAAVDRKAIAEIRFNGLNWSEEIPGSMMLMPFSEYYEDNYGKAIEGWEAGKILEEAGYKKDGDFYAKDGKNAKFSITNFGDDPVGNAMAQAIVQQVKNAGIDCSIDQQPDSNFGTILSSYDYDMTISGYSVGYDATGVVTQFYHSDNGQNGIGNQEIDKLIAEALVIEDDAERNKKCNEIEKKHMEEFASMGVIWNGPSISAIQAKLANYGPSLFATTHWENVGWVKE